MKMYDLLVYTSLTYCCMIDHFVTCSCMIEQFITYIFMIEQLEFTIYNEQL